MTQEEEIGATTIAPILIGVVCDEEKSCDQACLIGRAAKTPVPSPARSHPLRDSFLCGSRRLTAHDGLGYPRRSGGDRILAP
jgi:hypothetical protein